MKKLLLVLLLVATALSWAEKKPVNPADFTIAFHVQSSNVEANCSAPGCGYSQRIIALVDGKNYELLSNATPTPFLLRLGDYKARIVRDTSDQPYEYYRVYEVLFPGDKTQTYAIVGEHE